jgi:hypothetical protein
MFIQFCFLNCSHLILSGLDQGLTAMRSCPCHPIKIGQYRVARAVYFLPLIEFTSFISIIVINDSLRRQIND